MASVRTIMRNHYGVEILQMEGDTHRVNAWYEGTEEDCELASRLIARAIDKALRKRRPA